MAERFPGRDITKMYDALSARGAELGLEIRPVETLSNSRLALEAGEFARDVGTFDTFHEEVFRAYFSHGLDIGRFRVLRQVAERCGMDATALKSALESKSYAGRLAAVREDARRDGLTGLPTFVVEDKYKIVGAQPLEVFRDLFSRLSGETDEEEE